MSKPRFFLGMAALLLAACGGGGGGASGPSDPGVNTSLLLTLPEPGLKPAQLAVLVAQGDALSEAVATAYSQSRGIPAGNLIRVPGLNTAQHDISAADFATVRAFVQARLGADIQAMLVTWTAPSRVAGSCRMSLTSALAFGYDAAYCGPTATRLSPYYDSESLRPASDHGGLRPAMMLGATTLGQAQALIQRGLAADNSQPAGTGYLVRTSDANRNGRAFEFDALPAAWAGALALSALDRPPGDVLSNRSDVLLYLTGLPSVGGLNTLGFRPGAIADHMTSFGGVLPDSQQGQMPVTRWLEAGATASYGTVEEPLGFPEKFPRASVLVDHYWRGATLIEAYWKSVTWPGQGLFVGEPLARPFANRPSLTIEANQYRLQSKALRPDTRYALEYQNSSGGWTELGQVSTRRGQAVDVRFPLAPASATKLRWRGPCPGLAAAACTLAESS